MADASTSRPATAPRGWPTCCGGWHEAAIDGGAYRRGAGRHAPGRRRAVSVGAAGAGRRAMRRHRLRVQQPAQTRVLGRQRPMAVPAALAQRPFRLAASRRRGVRAERGTVAMADRRCRLAAPVCAGAGLVAAVSEAARAGADGRSRGC